MTEIIEIDPHNDAPMVPYAIEFRENGKTWASTIEAKTFSQAESLVSDRVTVLGRLLLTIPAS